MSEFNMADISKDIAAAGYDAISSVEEVRSDLMDQIVGAAASDSDKTITIGANAEGEGGQEIDISTGAGALVLDNALQELSTVEQVAAQLVAGSNRAQQRVHSQTGQG